VPKGQVSDLEIKLNFFILHST